MKKLDIRELFRLNSLVEGKLRCIVQKVTCDALLIENNVLIWRLTLHVLRFTFYFSRFIAEVGSISTILAQS